ncbi:MAG: hypothetical protein LBD97_10445 [Bifidobacteriaceae bacterium]|jgi:hypothetical protein|nr:hypothetical protein [Bifidobacteriaceae bacterium]
MLVSQATRSKAIPSAALAAVLGLAAAGCTEGGGAPATVSSASAGPSASAEERTFPVSAATTGGGADTDEFLAIALTADGGSIAAGATYSVDGVFPPSQGGYDALLARFDSELNLVWSNTLGGSADDAFWSVAAAADDGAVAAGRTSSTDGIFAPSRGGDSALLARFDGDGNLIWSTALGGTDASEFFAVGAAVDGGIVAVGQTSSVDGDFDPSAGGYDGLVARFDTDGNLLWSKTVGGAGDDSFFAMVTTADGGVIAAGATASADGDLPPSQGGGDALLVRFDADGELLWANTLGGAERDVFSAVLTVADGGIVVAGQTASTDGVFPPSQGADDTLVARFDAQGDLVWSNTLGGSGTDGFVAIGAAALGGVIVAGQTSSTDGPFAASRGGSDTLLAWFSPEGSLVWSKTLGDSADDGFSALATDAAGGATVAGWTASADDEDLPPSRGGDDVLVAKFDLAKLDLS